MEGVKNLQKEAMLSYCVSYLYSAPYIQTAKTQFRIKALYKCVLHVLGSCRKSASQRSSNWNSSIIMIKGRAILWKMVQNTILIFFFKKRVDMSVHFVNEIVTHCLNAVSFRGANIQIISNMKPAFISILRNFLIVLIQEDIFLLTLLINQTS